ncbi:autotransporter-associated beta strand repeat-containing protein [Salmonella enterica]|uniref:autotransporter-associated beta strand repeat-containing protein n=1 Tax=Salmonella enterica TaxID=28901 RepID=UPI001ED98C09|nr:autotransporter-associated beta strand repeat-containing protein [Salmonella enterica]
MKTGTGELTLNGDNDYSGGTTIDDGVLIAASVERAGQRRYRQQRRASGWRGRAEKYAFRQRLAGENRYGRADVKRR